MTLWLSYCAVGLVAGLMAGLLDVGGGIVMVPMLTCTFMAQQFPPHISSTSHWECLWQPSSLPRLQASEPNTGWGW